ncbi:MAG TPA: hypothetical protein VII56_09150 [Rhizomicrobium sp.]
MQSTEADTLIPVKQAVQNALAYVREFGDLFPSLSGARLEETEFDDERHEWVITMSFEESALYGGGRLYKIFRVDAASGDVTAMRYRRPE